MAFTRGKHVTLQKRWRGYRSDEPREQLPSGFLAKIVDCIPEFKGWALAQRARWEYACSTVGSGDGVDLIYGGVYAPFATPMNLAVGHDNGAGTSRLYDIITGTPSASKGALNGGAPVQNPFYYRDRVIAPAGSGAANPRSYDGTTFADLGGSPPQAKYGAAYKSRALLGNTTANPRRVWVNGLNATTGAPDPTVWNTGNNGDWFDLPADVMGFAPLRTACLIFTANRTFRLRGSTPGRIGDMALDPLFTNAGCFDAYSITAWEDNVIWADLNGIYMSDGGTLTNLTEQAGITKDWALNGGSNTVRITAGVYLDWLFVTQKLGSQYTTYLFDLNTRTCVSQLTNFTNMAYWSDGLGRLYGALGDEAKVMGAQQIFDISDTNGGKDEDTTAYLPYVETPFYRDEPGLSRLRFVYVGYAQKYDLSAGDTAPTTQVTYNSRYGESGYPYTGGTLTNTLDSSASTLINAKRRKRIPIKRAGEGVQFKIEALARSRDWGLDTIEVESFPMERFRLAR